MSVWLFKGSDVKTQKVMDLDLSDGLAYDAWVPIGVAGAAKMQVKVNNYFPMWYIHKGASCMLDPADGRSKVYLPYIDERASIRDAKRYNSSKIQNNTFTKGGGAFVYFQCNQEQCLTDFEVRVLPKFNPPISVATQFILDPDRILKFFVAVLMNPYAEEESLANVLVLMAELGRAEQYIAQVPLLLRVCLRSDWICRLCCQEVLHGTLYPDRHLLPLLTRAAAASTTAVETRVEL